jgi:hypothetical protein
LARIIDNCIKEIDKWIFCGKKNLKN